MNIVIVGGGFAGVKAALELSKRRVGKITLISDESYFLHHATLYATATGKNVAESVISLHDIFINHPNVTVVKDRVVTIDPERRYIIGKDAQYRYDEAIFAIGAVTSYFGVKGLEQHAYGIKSLDEVNRFRDHIFTEVIEKKLDKEYFIIGAGPTGVELAGAFQEYLLFLKKKYRLGNVRTRVTLVEAAPRILPSSSKTASKLVTKQLQKIGVRVLTHQSVDELDDDFISIEGKKIPTKTVVWTAGVSNHPFFLEHDSVFQLSPKGRAVVNPYLEAMAHVYVIGDSNNVAHSGAAWPAMGQGTFVAKHLARRKNRLPFLAFRPRSYTFGVPVGSRWGYVEWRGIYVSGRSGYVLRRLMELDGYMQLVHFQKAIASWRAHDLLQIDIQKP